MLNIKIHKRHIYHNVKWFLNHIGSSLFCMVLKSDAFGHGLINCLPIIKALSIPYVSICENNDARIIRQYFPNIKIFRCRVASVDEIIENIRDDLQIEEMVGDLQNAYIMEEICRKYNSCCPIHLNINCDLGRQGFFISSNLDSNHLVVFDKIFSLSHLQVVGLMTHLARRTPNCEERVDGCLGDFNQVVDKIQNKYGPLLVHVASTFLTLRNPKYHYDMVRVGAGCYGLAYYNQLPINSLKPCLSCTTEIIQINQAPKDITVGYRSKYTTDKITKIGLLPVGLFNGFWLFGDPDKKTKHVLIRDIKCPIMAVYSNSINIDVSEIADIKIGEPVSLISEKLPITENCPLKKCVRLIMLLRRLN